MGGGESNGEREWKRNRDKDRGAKKWWPSGMTQHPCRGLLNVPHASLTVTRRRMPGSDRCRTKGAVVYRYVPSLLPSLHPPILCLPLRETGPFPLQSSRRCVADLNVMAEERRKKKKEGGCRDWGLWWVRTQQAVQGGCALFLSYPFSPSTRWCVACFHLLTWNATVPLVDHHCVSCRLLTNTRRRGRHVCRTRRLVNRHPECHPLVSQLTSAPSVPLK